jgi:hypothetical protein
MSWLGLLGSILGAAGALLRYLQARQLVAAGEAVAIARNLKESIDAVDRAQTHGRRFDRLGDRDISELQERDYRD